jgi:hypothetical protein
MKGGEKRTVVTRLRVITIKREVKTASYRVEMRIAEPLVVPAPYVHRAHAKR